MPSFCKLLKGELPLLPVTSAVTPVTELPLPLRPRDPGDDDPCPILVSPVKSRSAGFSADSGV